jgi:microcompartment protein CcmL/EutN
MKPAIGLIELSSIARGLYVSDVMVKKAPVELLMSQTTSPGKYLILVSGDVASVQESTQAAIEQSENTSQYSTPSHQWVKKKIHKKQT